MNIQEIANEHSRQIIKNIFSKLDDEEKYVILELNNQLQDKINKIEKAIESIKITIKIIKEQPSFCELNDIWTLEHLNSFLEILGGKEWQQ